MRKTSSSKKRQAQQLRIIGGQWRGRKLGIANVEGLRPTGDRIRETLFNWLTGEIQESLCLDLFAGSGALGFECLSRGANKVIMLEKHLAAIQQLKENADQFNAKNIDIIHTDTLSWLKHSPIEKQSINIAFIDPPFSHMLWQPVIQQLEESHLLARDAAIYVETPKEQTLTTPTSWTRSKQKQAGAVCYHLFHFQGE